MSTKGRNIDRRRILFAVCAGGLLGFVGCEGGSGLPKLYPVAGRVTSEDGKPLTAGGVAFHADASKGNVAPVDCVSLIDSQGRFELKTRGVKASDSGTGAPLGWYRVTLVANPRGGQKPEIEVDPRFLKPETTPLLIEVVANPKPDAYDLKLSP